MNRLQKYIAESGYCSRRKAEELILNNKVKVNGEIVNVLGFKVDGNDEVMIDNILLKKEEKEYYLFYKPRGVISSTSDEKGRKTILDFFDSNKRLYPVGRLDYNTGGIILVTNDGDFSNLIMHPKNQLNKTYVAKVKGIVKGTAINKLKAGTIINRTKSVPSRVKLRSIDKNKKTSIVEIILHDGKNHEVKIMFERAGLLIEKLKREKIEFLDLKGLKPGQYRKLTIKEVKQLYGLVQQKKN